MTILKERVRELRPAYLPADPVSRTVYQPDELAQYDLWFPEADIPLDWGQAGRPPVLVMVSGYSRVITARMLPSEPPLPPSQTIFTVDTGRRPARAQNDARTPDP